MDNAIFYYKDHLLEWYRAAFPDVGAVNESFESLPHIATVYGREELLSEFQEEMAGYNDALDDDEMNGGSDIQDYT